MNHIAVNQHLVTTLKDIGDLIDTNAGILPAPTYVHVIVDLGTPDETATWARALFRSGVTTNDDGMTGAERWYGALTAVRVQAHADGTL